MQVLTILSIRCMNFFVAGSSWSPFYHQEACTVEHSEAFLKLLRSMAERAHEYITPEGHVTNQRISWPCFEVLWKAT